MNQEEINKKVLDALIDKAACEFCEEPYKKIKMFQCPTCALYICNDCDSEQTMECKECRSLHCINCYCPHDCRPEWDD